MLKYNLRRIRRVFRLKSSKNSNNIHINKTKLVNKNVEEKSTKIINLVGYVILLLTLLDYAFLLFPSNFFEPSWIYNIAGHLVENVWAFLLGFLLIFYRRNQELIRPREFTFLSFISWVTLAIGIIYFLITPLIIGNAFRINRSQQAQAKIQIEQQKNQVEQYSKQLNRVSSEQLNNLFQNYQQQNPNQEITSVQKLKDNLLIEVKQKQEIASNKLQTKARKQKLNLLKTTIKLSIGAIISSISFLLIWKYTKWTRSRS
ncbi:MAG: HpsJ family protein [Cyanobacteria bacterium P01_F01_bin.143]